VVYLGSHGGQFDDKSGVAVALADNSPGLSDSELHNLLQTYVATKPGVRMLLVVDACHSGGFSGLSDIPNLCIVTSTPDASTLSDFMSLPGMDGTGVFTNALTALILQGIVDPSVWGSQINTGVPAGLFGTTLSLEDTGTMPFNGLSPLVLKTPGFSGDLYGPSLIVPEPTFASFAVIALLSNLVVRGRGRASQK
jgi:hypothetical protein